MILRLFSTVVIAISVTTVSIRADECDTPKPIRVPTVCGRTLLMTGGDFEAPEGTPYAYAEVVSRQRVQLWRGNEKVAETDADENGAFAFPPVAKGPYRVTVPFLEGVGINWPIIVTKNRGDRCEKPLFLYLRPEAKVCWGDASLIKPLEIAPDTVRKKPR